MFWKLLQNTEMCEDHMQLSKQTEKVAADIRENIRQ